MDTLSTLRSSLLLVWLLGSTTAIAAELQPPALVASLTSLQPQTMSPKTLRGYGWVTGSFNEYVGASGSQSSVLIISCADTTHAALCLGKYLSDLRCLGGVTDEQRVVDGVEWRVITVEGQGEHRRLSCPASSGNRRCGRAARRVRTVVGHVVSESG